MGRCHCHRLLPDTMRLGRKLNDRLEQAPQASFHFPQIFQQELYE